MKNTIELGLLRGDVDWPTEVWSDALHFETTAKQAKRKLEAIRDEQSRGRHVRANRVEMAEDDLLDAERSLLVIQRRLGLEHPEPSSEALCEALGEAVAHSDGNIRTSFGRALPHDVASKIASFVLPLQLARSRSSSFASTRTLSSLSSSSSSLCLAPA